MQPDPTTPQPEIEALLLEQRTFAPDPAFAAAANATAALYEEAERDPEAFWAAQARERISWVTPFETTLEWDLPFAKWFSVPPPNHFANGRSHSRVVSKGVTQLIRSRAWAAQNASGSRSASS